MKTKKVRAKALNSRLAAYSATATAALLIVPAAKATIQNITISDLSSNGVAGAVPILSINGDVQLSFGAGPMAGSLYGFLGLGYAGLLGRFATTQGGFVKHLAKSASIGGLHFATNATVDHNFLFNGSPNEVVTDYVGFKTNNYYGWLRIQVSLNSNGKLNKIMLVPKNGSSDIFGAYGTAGDNVWAGIVATPEPSVTALGGLALLACGAVGVREMRRRRQTETAKAE